MSHAGRATPEGTARFAARHAGTGQGHFRKSKNLTWSSLGIGTYLGAGDEATDGLVADAVDAVVAGGMNVIDSAANYRRERGEKSVGVALERVFTTGVAKRDEVVVCTKGGFLPHGQAWFEKEFIGKQGIAADDLVGGSHCMHPDYLAAQLDRSLENLGLETIDVHYVHNPESQAGKVAPEIFQARLEAAFRFLEGAVQAGKIGAYGVATWNAFRVPGKTPGAMSLNDTKHLARRATDGTADHLSYVQLPLNLAMTEALVKPTQEIGAETLAAIRAATTLGLRVLTSGSIRQGKLGALPDAIAGALGKDLKSDAQRALQFTRSAPGVGTALVGLKQPAHVAEALDLCRRAPLAPAAVLGMFRKPPATG